MGADRFYRNWCEYSDLVPFDVSVKESDLYIRARRNLSRKALKAIMKYRAQIEKYIERNPWFLSSREPVEITGSAPLIVKKMAEAAGKAGVGPMAAVAGAIAEFVGKDLLDFSPEVIVENGGDIFMKSLKVRTVGLFAGSSAFTRKIAIEIAPNKTPIGICTSSGTVGHSFSCGRADAAVAISRSAVLADAAATAIGNNVKEESDITRGIEVAKSIKGIIGALIIKNDKMGVWGDVKIKGE